MEREFLLPIGFKHNGSEFKKLPIAETTGEAEKVYAKKPSQTKLYTWFGQLISVSVENIGDEMVSADFLKAGKDQTEISEAVKSIALVDVGTLLLQIQRECWEEIIKEQRLKCSNCGGSLSADIELQKIPVPYKEDSEVITELVVKLTRTYTIKTGIEQMSAYEGATFNHLVFRVPTLGDAIKHQEISKDDILFWRKLAFDCLTGLYYQKDADSEKEEVADGYINKRGMVLFTKDLSTPTLKEIRNGLQTQLPSAKFYYEEDCPLCNTATPYFASVGNFFST